MKEATEACKKNILEYIKKGILKDSMDCISYAVGYFELDYDSIPIELLLFINNLGKKGTINR